VPSSSVVTVHQTTHHDIPEGENWICRTTTVRASTPTREIYLATCEAGISVKVTENF